MPYTQGPCPALAAQLAQSVWQGCSNASEQSWQPSRLEQVTARRCLPLPQLFVHALHCEYCRARLVQKTIAATEA